MAVPPASSSAADQLEHCFLLQHHAAPSECTPLSTALLTLIGIDYACNFPQVVWNMQYLVTWCQIGDPFVFRSGHRKAGLHLYVKPVSALHVEAAPSNIVLTLVVHMPASRLQLCVDFAAFLQVVDVRWYAVHCVAMMNQLVSSTRLTKAVYQFANSVLTLPCNTHHACEISDAMGCNVFHVATCLTYPILNYVLCIIVLLFPPASIQSVAALQDDASKQQLVLQVLTEEEQLECFLRERSRSLDVKVQQAALWLPTVTQTYNPSQHDQYDQQPQAMDTPSDSNSKNQAAGYVNVSGIELPCRAVEAPSLAITGPAQRLVHTPAMVDNIKAAVLALCQNRPLLLEGPPGWSCLLGLVAITSAIVVWFIEYTTAEWVPRQSNNQKGLHHCIASSGTSRLLICGC